MGQHSMGLHKKLELKLVTKGRNPRVKRPKYIKEHKTNTWLGLVNRVKMAEHILIVQKSLI